MSRDKQIEEMAEIICQNTEFDTMWNEIYDSANALYNAGYRKASEVAEEIFAEIEKEICNIKYEVSASRYTHIPVETMVEVCNWILQDCIPKKIAELKKKYTEGEYDGTDSTSS